MIENYDDFELYKTQEPLDVDYYGIVYGETRRI